MTGDEGGTGGSSREGDTPLAGPVVGVSSFGLLVAGLALLRAGEPGAIASGVLLLVAALALAAVALGGAAHGPLAEGRLDLSSRLGLGHLGGFLGAAGAMVAQWAITVVGIPDLLGVALPGLGDPGGAVSRLLGGAVWGLLFGVLLPWIPGFGVLARGAVFSLVPSLLVLFVVYPLRAGHGLLGLELGSLAFVFVLLLNGVWGIVTAWVVSWGARSELAPVSGPLGA